MGSSWAFLAVITFIFGIAGLAVVVDGGGGGEGTATTVKKDQGVQTGLAMAIDGGGGGVEGTTTDVNVKKADRRLQRGMAMTVDGGGGQGTTTTVDQNITIKDQGVQIWLAMAVDGEGGHEGTTMTVENMKNDEQRLQRRIAVAVDAGEGMTTAVGNFKKDGGVKRGVGGGASSVHAYNHPTSAVFHNPMQMKPAFMFQKAVAVERRRLLPTDYSLRGRFRNQRRRRRSHVHRSQDCPRSVGVRALGSVSIFWGFLLICAALQEFLHH